MGRGSKTYSDTRRSLTKYLRQSLLTGTAIVLPVLVTAFIFLLIVDLLSGLLNPLAIPIQEGLGFTSPLVPQLIAIVVLFSTILFVGAFTESRVGGDRLKQSLDAIIARIPGIRSIYGPLDQISTMLLEDGRIRPVALDDATHVRRHPVALPGVQFNDRDRVLFRTELLCGVAADPTAADDDNVSCHGYDRGCVWFGNAERSNDRSGTRGDEGRLTLAVRGRQPIESITVRVWWAVANVFAGEE
jgi:hypothetical protein